MAHEVAEKKEEWRMKWGKKEWVAHEVQKMRYGWRMKWGKRGRVAPVSALD